MTYTPRLYPDIVRDLLTTLTGGTVRERLPVPPGEVALVPLLLRDRPVRRVSHLEGRTEVGTGAKRREVDYRFTDADFELISTSGDGAAKDAIRFRPKGQRPVPGSTLTVNYYPVQTAPVPLTDLNVGSVTRTLTETVALELALAYQHLDHVYRSAFLATAEASSLDNVVALIGLARHPAGKPVVTLRFSRRPDSAGRIAIPAGTPVTDADGNRYLTTVELIVEPGESVREVLAVGDSASTKVVDEGALTRLEVAIAGVSTVVNPQPARPLAAPEADEDLRRRAAGALHGVVRGTLDALTFALRSVQGVSDVKLVEAPNGVPGEIRVDVAYADPSDAVRRLVDQTISDFRPAGIRVIPNEAQRLRVQVRVALTLAGAGLPAGQLGQLTRAVEERLAEYLSKLPPGGTARRSRLSALVLQDAGVADAQVTLSPQGLPSTEELALGDGQVAEVVRPFDFPAPATETAPPVTARTSQVSAVLPVHLVPGVTADNATRAIDLAVASHLASRGPEAPLTVDGLVAAVRDDTRFSLIRSAVTVTVEGDGAFRQLTDQVGAYAPAPGETLAAAQIQVDPREGGV